MVGIFSLGGIGGTQRPSLGFALIGSLSSATQARSLRVAALASQQAPRESVTNASEQARLNAQAREAERTIKGLTRLKSRQKNALNTLTKAREGLEEMKGLLLEAREFLVKADNPETTTENKRIFADKFDQLIGKLNLVAKTSGRNNVNLIGGSARDVFEAQDLEVQVRPDSLVTKTYFGKYLGSDYAITDLSSNLFLPNLFGSAVVQFPPPDPDDVGTLLKDDDVVSYDSASGAVSITRNGDATPTIEGTLEKKGLGVLHSYFYGNFEDQTLRDVALQDVTDALQTLRFNISVFQSQETQAKVSFELSEKLIDEAASTVGRIEGQKFATEQRAALEEQKRQLLFQQAFQTSFSGAGQGVLLLQQGSLFDFEA